IGTRRRKEEDWRWSQQPSVSHTHTWPLRLKAVRSFSRNHRFPLQQQQTCPYTIRIGDRSSSCLLPELSFLVPRKTLKKNTRDSPSPFLILSSPVDYLPITPTRFLTFSVTIKPRQPAHPFLQLPQERSRRRRQDRGRPSQDDMDFPRGPHQEPRPQHQPHVGDGGPWEMHTAAPEAVMQKNHEFREITKQAKEMGFNPQKTTFVLAIHALSGKGNRSIWDKCFEVYQRWGLSEEDIMCAFKKHPHCMMLSERK
ncbi:unnamed protein product, partial [Brassica oleracea var. botrytis]